MVTLRLFLATLSFLSYKMLFCSERNISIAATILCVICALCLTAMLNDAFHVVVLNQYNSTDLMWNETCAHAQESGRHLHSGAMKLWNSLNLVLW